jgi:phosphoribosyl 1,2-cyclic phosphodiesterase/CheY-like chemotaxis protein
MSDTSSEKPYVLVAEDIRSIALTISAALESAGIEVGLAADGEQCLEKVYERRPDLLILDLMMPKMHGIDVLKVLRAHDDHCTRQLPVVVCTTKQFFTEMRQVEELGVIGTLIKPFDRTEFVAAVRGYLKDLPGCPDTPTDLSDDSASADAAEPRSRSAAPYLPKPNSARLAFRLWGTRGSIPVSGASYVRHGGNTSCVSVDLGDDLIIIDAGSGIRDLGNTLITQGADKHIHLFISHTHWDHIQGFPFFTPAYIPGRKITVYGERGFGKNLESVLLGQLDSDYFPVQFEDMNADIVFDYLSDEPVQVGDAVVTREYVNHPGATVGYKIAIHGKTFVYISDNEFLQGYLGAPGDLALDAPEILPHQKTLDFARGADILLHEAQYTNEEYPTKVGWGHSCMSNACLFAKIANPGRWVVSHHDPLHSDDFLDSKERLTRDILGSIDCEVRVDHGYDGMLLQL